MTKFRLLSTMTLTAVLLLPSGAVVAQDDADASPAPEATMAVDDPRLAELEALIPPALAGLPLGDNLVLATGEELVSVMKPEESDILLALLDEHDKTTADYAAATTWLPISDSDVVVVQAHRVAGVDASETIATWVEILSLGLEEPDIAEGFISGRPVTLVSDASRPEVPLLHLYPAGDVMWMIVAADQAIVEEAVGAVDGEKTEEAEATDEAA